jgi:hypothetical protein
VGAGGLGIDLAEIDFNAPIGEIDTNGIKGSTGMG